MRLSKFNEIIKCGDEYLLYNLYSGAILVLDEHYKERYEQIKKGKKDIDKELLSNLQKGKMLTDDRNEVRKIMEESDFIRKENKTLNLTIAPTMKCNFRCPYCYEKGVEYRTMDQQVIDGTIDFILRMKEKSEKLEVTWYGGEPLLAMDIIERISEKAIKIFGKENYNANMVTNGYLLTGEIAEKLEKLQIERLQITLDGEPGIHNKRRKLAKDENTFEVIIRNIKNIIESDRNLQFIIRINVDNDNAKSIGKILDYFEELGLKGKLDVYLAPVRTMNGQCNNEKCFAEKEFADTEINFIKIGLEKGYDFLELPECNLGICGAVSQNCYVINAKGNIFKCLNDIAKDECKIGDVLHPLDCENEKFVEWISYEIPDECKECKILPICMGGCPVLRRKEKKACPAVKYNYQKLLQLVNEWSKKEYEK